MIERTMACQTCGGDPYYRMNGYVVACHTCKGYGKITIGRWLEVQAALPRKKDDGLHQ